MTTRYPTDLPDVPEDRWNARQMGYGGDIDYLRDAWSTWEVDAEDEVEAEHRVIAHIDYDYEDNLRGWTAEALTELHPGRWLVHMRQGEYTNGN